MTEDKADPTKPPYHDEEHGGCWSCGTCICHDSCADDVESLDLKRGDCPECGACGDCIRECIAIRQQLAEPVVISR